MAQPAPVIIIIIIGAMLACNEGPLPGAPPAGRPVPPSLQAPQDFPHGAYVRLIGNLKTFNNKHYISAFSTRRILDHNEVRGACRMDASCHGMHAWHGTACMHGGWVGGPCMIGRR